MGKNYIPVPFPHMVLNSHDVPEPDYEMWNSWKVATSVTSEGMTDWIRKVALGAPNGNGLATLIFNSHGSPGRIHIGRGLSEQDMHNFYILRKDENIGLCKRIWIIACRVAGKNDESTDKTGDSFCLALAAATRSEVTAALREQDSSGPISIPPWHVDDWVGEVFTYYPGGTKKKIR